MNSRIKIFLSFFIFFCISTDLVAQENHNDNVTWLKVLANLREYFIVIDGDYLNAQLVQRGDSIPVEAGEKKITIVSELINDATVLLNIIEGQTNTHRITFETFPYHTSSSFQELKQQFNLAIYTDTASSIFINGEYIGDHTAKILIPSGNHKIRIKHPEEGELEYSFFKYIHKTDQVFRYNKNRNEISFAAHFLPGAGYISNRSTIKYITTYSLMAGLTGIYIAQNKEYQDTHAKYQHYELLYAKTTNTKDAITFRNEANKAISSLKSTKNKMAGTAILLGATYIISTIDGFRKPKGGYKGSYISKKHDISLESYSFNNTFTPALSYKYHFQ